MPYLSPLPRAIARFCSLQLMSPAPWFLEARIEWNSTLDRSLQEVFEAVRGLADDVEFSRNPSTGRPVDLA